MAARSWLDEIQARVAARGMSTAELARAAGMKPGNLRRLLKSSPESPRLGTMMRLLEPLGYRIAPAGARTAAELATYLDGLRRQRNLDWATVCEGSRVAVKVAERLSTSPEELSLGAVLELARRLDVALTLATEDAAPSPAHEPPRRSASSRTRGPARTPPLADSTPSPSLEPAAPPSAPAPATPPDHEPALASPWRLRPPRLGRYRDAPAAPTSERPPPPSYVPPAPSYALEHSLLGKLADFTVDDWSSAYTELFHTIAGAAKAPVQMITDMARATEQWFAKLRRPRADPEPEGVPDNVFAGADPTPLVQAWMRAKTPDGGAEVAQTRHDEYGRAHKIHLALDPKFGVVVRLGQGETPHTLARQFFCPRPGMAMVLSDPGVPLIVRIGDAQHRFTHADAGPVFAELALADRVLLLAAVSWAIVLVQIDAAGARVLWGGRPEEFVGVRVDAPASPSTPEQPCEPVAAPDDGDRLAALQRALAEERRAHAATRSAAARELEELRAQRTEAFSQGEAARSALADARCAHEQQLAEEQAKCAALESTARAGLATWMMLSLEMARALDATRERLAAAEQAAQDSRTRLEALAQENAELSRQLAKSTELIETRLVALDEKERAMDEFKTVIGARFEAMSRKVAELKTENAALRDKLAQVPRTPPRPKPSPPDDRAIPQSLATAPPHAPEATDLELTLVAKDADTPADEDAAPLERATPPTATGRSAQAIEKRKRRRRR